MVPLRFPRKKKTPKDGIIVKLVGTHCSIVKRDSFFRHGARIFHIASILIAILMVYIHIYIYICIHIYIYDYYHWDFDTGISWSNSEISVRRHLFPNRLDTVGRRGSGGGLWIGGDQATNGGFLLGKTPIKMLKTP